MNARSRSQAILLWICALATLWPACRAEQPPAPSLAPRVSLAPVHSCDVEERIEASGELVAVEQAEIAAEVEGRITELLHDEGSAVEAGEALLTIDPERRELELASARAQVAEAKAGVGERRREHSRLERLHQRGAVSSAGLDAAETALAAADSRRRAAEARLGVAERALRDATVRAPFAGLLARRFVSRGEFVRPGEPLLELVSLSPIELVFHLAEKDSSRVRLGLVVGAQVAPYPEEVFEAWVTMISPTIDPRTRTLRVKAALDNSDGRLRPGLFARADLGVALRSGALMVPEEAVLQRADGAVVFRFTEDDRVERRVVRTGSHRDGAGEVLDGLAPGDWVVSRGHDSLQDGALVQPREPDGASVSRPLARADAGDASTR
jgi:membrane fusion protein (multidrug efflux system)